MSGNTFTVAGSLAVAIQLCLHPVLSSKSHSKIWFEREWGAWGVHWKASRLFWFAGLLKQSNENDLTCCDDITFIINAINCKVTQL